MILHLLHYSIDKGLHSCLLDELISLLCLVRVNLDMDGLSARHRMEARVQVRYHCHDVIELIHG
jgi:hypothetical protein